MRGTASRVNADGRDRSADHDIFDSDPFQGFIEFCAGEGVQASLALHGDDAVSVFIELLNDVTAMCSGLESFYLGDGLQDADRVN